MLQILDTRGYPTGYRMEVDSVICLGAQCEIIPCLMVWDVLGRYRRYELAAGTTLTKAPATSIAEEEAWREESLPFTQQDYEKLDQILNDPSSLLKDQTLASMSPSAEHGDVDGITGATPQELAASVVKGAALTCFNLWHWAHGDVATLARELTHQHCDAFFLSRLLASEQEHEMLFALAHLQRHALHGPAVTQQVVERISAGPAEGVKLGLLYLEAAPANAAQFGSALVQVYAAGDAAVRMQVLDEVKDRMDLPPAVFEGFCASVGDHSPYLEIHRLLTLMEHRGMVSPKALRAISGLLVSEDFFIARRAYWFLREQPLDADLHQRVVAFQERHQDRRGQL